MTNEVTGIMTVKLRVNRSVWRRIDDESERTGASHSVVLAAAMDAYDTLAITEPGGGVTNDPAQKLPVILWPKGSEPRR